MIWLSSLFRRENLITEDGSRVDIIFEGLLNNNTGPDFRFAKIYINGLLCIGDIELHLSAAGWKNHGHSEDHKYGNVILHVCLYRSDDGLNSFDFSKIPLLVLQPYLYESICDTALAVKAISGLSINNFEFYGLKWLKGKVEAYLRLLELKSLCDVLSDAVIEAIGYPSNKFASKYVHSSFLRPGNKSIIPSSDMVRKGCNSRHFFSNFEKLIKIYDDNRHRLSDFVDEIEHSDFKNEAPVCTEGLFIEMISCLFNGVLSRQKVRIIIFNTVLPILISRLIMCERYEVADVFKKLYYDCDVLMENRRIRSMKELAQRVLNICDPLDSPLAHFGLIYLAKQIESA